LIIELRDNLTTVQRILGKVAKLDIAIAFATYIKSQQVPMTRPVIIND
jgi:hypothetical protein